MVSGDYVGEGVNNVLICDFGSLGLWRYYGKLGSWYKLTHHSPDGW